MTGMVTIFKYDFFFQLWILPNPPANSAVRNTVGFIYMGQISMDGYLIVFQFHLCEYLETGLLSLGIFFSGTADDIMFLIASNIHIADDVNTILCMVIG